MFSVFNKLFTTYLLFNTYLFNARPVVPACLTCETDCVKCTGLQSIDGANLVTLDMSSCKNGDTMSWMCCQSCNEIDTCDGSVNGLKCDELTQVSYFVDPSVDVLTVQVHDGRLAGDVDCSAGGCCGGSGTSCGTVSGVCNFAIDLSSCPRDEGEGGGEVEQGDVVDPIQCFRDDQCSAPPCGVASCVNNQCVTVPKPQNTICRAAADVCDQPEVCDGSSLFCPLEDVKYGSETVCRPSAGVCDVAETCDGVSDGCGLDVKRGSETVCRPAVMGTDGTTCDIAEVCDGVEDTCPLDRFKGLGDVCRPSADPCDVADVCSGTSSACPSNLRNDYATTFKCANTCYLCGVEPTEIAKNKGGASMLGECTFGKCDEYVVLPWPECENQCVNRLCPNNRGLSNIAHYKCNEDTGSWSCMDKTDVGSSTPMPVCPFWMS